MEDIKAPSLAPMVSVPRRIQCHLLSFWLFFFFFGGTPKVSLPLLRPSFSCPQVNSYHDESFTSVRESVKSKSAVRSLPLVLNPL